MSATEQMIQEAYAFLTDPAVQGTPVEMQISYMRERLGLNDTQIRDLLLRLGYGAPGGAPASAAPQPAFVGLPPAARKDAAAPPPPGAGQFYAHVKPPPVDDGLDDGFVGLPQAGVGLAAPAQAPGRVDQPEIGDILGLGGAWGGNQVPAMDAATLAAHRARTVAEVDTTRYGRKKPGLDVRDEGKDAMGSIFGMGARFDDMGLGRDRPSGVILSGNRAALPRGELHVAHDGTDKELDDRRAMRPPLREREAAGPNSGPAGWQSKGDAPVPEEGWHNRDVRKVACGRRTAQFEDAKSDAASCFSMPGWSEAPQRRAAHGGAAAQRDGSHAAGSRTVRVDAAPVDAENGGWHNAHTGVPNADEVRRKTANFGDDNADGGALGSIIGAGAGSSGSMDVSRPGHDSFAAMARASVQEAAWKERVEQERVVADVRKKNAGTRLW